MRTNIEIDDELMRQVMERSGATTKKAAVEIAMEFYVRLQAQGDIRQLRGKVQFWDGYDYKAMRRDRTNFDEDQEPSPTEASEKAA